MEKHVTAVAAIHIGFSVLGILIAIFVFFILEIIGIASQDRDAHLILTIIGSSVALILLILSVPSIIGGVGLFKKRNWARILVLVISAIDLINFPIGTAIGVYSIWVLVQDETVKLFMVK